MANKFEGPFKITKKENDIYHLENVNSRKTVIRHINQLKRYQTNQAASKEIVACVLEKPDTTQKMAIMNHRGTVIIILIMGSCLTSAIEKIHFMETDPIKWTMTDEQPLDSRKTYKLKVKFGSSCESLGYNYNQTYGKEGIIRTVASCHEIFDKGILIPIQKFARSGQVLIRDNDAFRSRHKRGLPLLALGTGWILSNVISTS